MTNPELIFNQTNWCLSELFSSPDSPKLDEAFLTLEKRVEHFESQRKFLSPEINNELFLSLLCEYENIVSLENVIYSYAGLLFSENTQNQIAQSLLNRADQLTAEVNNRTLFFSLWWKDLDDNQAQRLMANTGDYSYWLEEIRRYKPHTLSEAEEKIINIKNVTGTNALTNLYDSITNRYTFKINIDGEEKELTRGELMVYARHTDPDLRSSAYKELYRIYGADGSILGQMYQTIARDWRNEQVNLRGFSNPIQARNLANDIPDDVVETLLDVCQKNVEVFQRYFNLKARCLGVDRLRRFDIYAPITKSDRTFLYSDAVKMVFDSFYRFNPSFSNYAQKVFQENHLDSEIRKGKRSGAFCWTVTPKITPWVLLNFQGRVDDVTTMAHELGHAVHSMLASQHSILTSGASLPLAETASTFGEMLLVDYLLEQETDELVRRDVLFKQMDDSYATIMRQAFFALFEIQAHEMINDNATVDDIAAAYLSNLKSQFGDSILISDEFKWEWVSIPHIYQSPFYVYSYTFGQLLVLSLYQQFKSEGESFIPRYIKILEAGGSKSPEIILSEADIDIHKADFWQGGFNVIQKLIEQLEAIQ
jgi:oligoendopeptidase F